MRQLARERGGKCLSAVYINGHTKLRWRCEDGHEWEAEPAAVKYGTWCPTCAGTKKLTLEALRAVAEKRGGKLLSSEYHNLQSPLTWECADGHQWDAAAMGIQHGKWCPRCAGNGRLSIEEMRALAQANGGECLSKRYVNNTTHLKWRCAQGHIWRAAPVTIKPTGYQERGTWCPVCARNSIYSLADMNELAARRGGECVSKTYVNEKTPLKWRCAKGHTWKATPNSIRPYTEKTKGSWCPFCANERRKLTIEEMKAVASSRGGECLSATYVNNKTPLLWRCDKGHQWQATPKRVRRSGLGQRGNWCPECADRTPALPVATKKRAE